MSLKDKWKKFGKSTGRAFANFGRSMKTTAKIILDEEENTVDENGESKLHKSWRTTGRGFGEAGTNLGKAAAGTAKRVVDDLDEEVKAERSNNKQKEEATSDNTETVEVEVVPDDEKKAD